MRTISPLLTVPILLSALASPDLLAREVTSPGDTAARWYSAAELERGRTLFQANCAACHGDRGQGQPGWEERDESGYYPAPPLDGTGHSANHPIEQMLRTLDTGGGPMGGTMPSFQDVLDDAGKRAVIAWFQSLWPAATYEAWTRLAND
ncbi:MAG: cytochrome c [Gammaproteobacteria bacterium]